MSQIISPAQISDPGFHFDFSGRTAVVTGGTDGIGLGTALAFARAHAQIVVCSRSEDRVRRAEARLKEEGGAVLGIATDARDETAVARLFDAAVDRFGGVDILVNNVGGSFSDSFTRAPILSLSSTDLLEAFRLNVVSTFNCTRLAVPLMRSRGSGSIVNVTSVAARGVSGAMGAYGGSKAALDNLTRTMAEEFAPEIRVNSVAPGAIATERTAADHVGNIGRILMGRIGTPEDVANLICFLASPAASWITGTVVNIDGGVRLGAVSQPAVTVKRDVNRETPSPAV